MRNKHIQLGFHDAILHNPFFFFFCSECDITPSAARQARDIKVLRASGSPGLNNSPSQACPSEKKKTRATDSESGSFTSAK